MEDEPPSTPRRTKRTEPFGSPGSPGKRIRADNSWIGDNHNDPDPNGGTVSMLDDLGNLMISDDMRAHGRHAELQKLLSV